MCGSRRLQSRAYLVGHGSTLVAGPGQGSIPTHLDSWAPAPLSSPRLLFSVLEKLFTGDVKFTAHADWGFLRKGDGGWSVGKMAPDSQSQEGLGPAGWVSPLANPHLLPASPWSFHAALYASSISVWLPAAETALPLPAPTPSSSGWQETANLTCVSSSPFFSGGCHGNPQGSIGFLIDWPGPEKPFWNWQCYIWGKFNERAGWPSFNASQWNGRDVRCYWKEEIVGTRGMHKAMEAKMSSCFIYCLIFQRDSAELHHSRHKSPKEWRHFRKGRSIEFLFHSLRKIRTNSSFLKEENKTKLYSPVLETVMKNMGKTSLAIELQVYLLCSYRSAQFPEAFVAGVPGQPCLLVLRSPLPICVASLIDLLLMTGMW